MHRLACMLAHIAIKSADLAIDVLLYVVCQLDAVGDNFERLPFSLIYADGWLIRDKWSGEDRPITFQQALANARLFYHG